MVLVWGLWFLVTSYMLFFWWTLARELIPLCSTIEGDSQTTKDRAISLIIVSRNDLPQLKKNISKILKQDHQNIEFVIVDDSSDDGTYDWLQNKEKDDNRIKVLLHKKISGGKKAALELGIKHTSNNFLLFTDADCQPASRYWLQIMSKKLRSHDVVLGYGPYYKASGLSNKFFRFDTALIAIQYLARAVKGHPYMGVGRNMAYKKSVFEAVEGFVEHRDLSSGDDDLFIQSIPKGCQMAISLEADSFVYSDSPATWSNFIKQKSRHLSTSNRYKLRDKLWLISYPFMLLIFYVLSAYLFILFPIYIFGLVIMRWVLMILILRKIFTHLKESDLLYFIPIMDLLYLPTYSIVYFYRILNKDVEWK